MPFSLLPVLKKLAPLTPEETLRTFAHFLEEACPRYQINSPANLAAFLATCAYESMYFNKTREGRARAGTKARAYQDKYWSSGFYGRGLIQLTHKKNYDAFFAYLDQQHVLYPTVNGKYRPEDVEGARLAVESACWFWRTNDCEKYALTGNFFATQGIVNRGSATKEALDYATREKLYRAALKALSGQSQPIPKPADPPPVDPPLPTAKPSEPNSTSPLSVDAPPSSSAPTFSVTSKISDGVDYLQGLADRSSNIEASVSKSSWATVIFNKSLGVVLMAFGWLFNNPLYLIAGIVLIAIAVWYLKSAKDRLNDRKIFNKQ